MTGDDTVRPCVASFAKAMELKLRRDDGSKGEEGWKTAPLSLMTQRLLEEFIELVDAIDKDTTDPDEVMLECVDVANFAMFIYDIMNDRKGKKDGRHGVSVVPTGT